MLALSIASAWTAIALSILAPNAEAFTFFSGQRSATKGLVNPIADSRTVCGSGVRTRGLIWGETPFSACILGGTKQKGVFGWNLW